MKKYLITAIFLLPGLTCFSQHEDTSSEIPVEVLESVLYFKPEVKALPQERNQVFIQQIGNMNFTNASIYAEASELNFLQRGDQNFIGLYADVKTLDVNIIQNGDHNKNFKFINAPAEDVTLNITQNGNYGHFESYGSNSIGNNLEFELNGDYKSIIVRNFK